MEPLFQVGNQVFSTSENRRMQVVEVIPTENYGWQYLCEWLEINRTVNSILQETDLVLIED
jgi:hypothetical protein